MNNQVNNRKVAVIGLGYVGLPLLYHFATKFQCVGLDISEGRIQQLSRGFDSKKCIDLNQSPILNQVKLTSDWNDLRNSNIYFVTAPKPIDDSMQPDLHSLRDICSHIGTVINKGDIIIFESTVSPGTTEEMCIPIIEEISSMKLNDDFAVGYSPERINIGDTAHTLKNVPKVVSASNSEALLVISEIYNIALGCNTIPASSIKTAEAAKLYENVQRDVLIALANQYAEYCCLEGISINEVTQCAATKWNFAEVYPGLVGGHCIGVDPYYLIDRADKVGIEMSLVKNARNINELKTNKIINDILCQLTSVNAKNVLFVGLTYKPNTSDLRNSKALEIVRAISVQMQNVSVYDPNIMSSDLPNELQSLYYSDYLSDYWFDVVITLVDHSDVISPKGKILNINICK